MRAEKIRIGKKVQYLNNRSFKKKIEETKFQRDNSKTFPRIKGECSA